MTHFRGTDSLFVKGSIRQHTQKKGRRQKKTLRHSECVDLAKFMWTKINRTWER